MVNPMSVFCMSTSFLFSLLVPIVVMIVLCCMKKLSFKGVLMGISLFCMVEIVWILVFNILLSVNAIATALQNTFWLASLLQSGIMAILLAFGRYFMNKNMLGELSTWRGNCAFGLGYGIVYTGMYFSIRILNDMMAAVALNQESTETALEDAIPYVIENQERLCSTPFFEFLFPGLDAIAIILIQIALCLLILYAFKRQKTSFVWLTAGIQTAVYMTYDLLQNAFGGTVATTAVVVFGIGSIVWMTKSKEIFNDELKQPFSRRSPLL